MMKFKHKDQNNQIPYASTAQRVFYRTSSINHGAKIQFRIGFVLLAIPLVLFLISFFYQPYDTTAMNMAERFAAPGSEHWFGTDNYGRDIFTRVMSGLPLTIIISIGINLIGSLSGLVIGALSGYYGGVVDYWGNRFSDALLSIPAILMGMLFVATFGNGIWQVIVALGIMFIPSYMRVIRSGFLEYRQRNFVKRLQLLGASSARIIWRHLFPQIRTRLMSAIALGFANAILAESSLSFLGLGVPPSQITWGRMLKDAQGFLFQAPWSAIAPGLMIVTLVLGSFFISNGLKQISQQRILA
ncbi:MAG: ABC transporter permease [Saccharofermentanales bacterium]|jgi:peptide/nickel transport system permease protein